MPYTNEDVIHAGRIYEKARQTRIDAKEAEREAKDIVIALAGADTVYTHQGSRVSVSSVAGHEYLNVGDLIEDLYSEFDMDKISELIYRNTQITDGYHNVSFKE